MSYFWKKYGAAFGISVFLLTAVILVVLTLGGKAAERHYYSKWIVDDVGLISSETKEEIADVIQALDENYGSIMGVVITDEIHGVGTADHAYMLQKTYGFGNCDLMLLICPGARKHYLADGDVIAGYYPNSLRIALQEQFAGDLYAEESADAAILQIYDTAVQWYSDNVPQNIGQRSQRSRAAGGTEVLMTLLLLITGAFLLLCLVRYLFWPLFFIKTTGKWNPLGGWHILGPLKKK